MKHILILMTMLLVGCASSSPQATQLGENNKGLGWNQNNNNLVFNSGPLKKDFPNSPVGKVWYYFFTDNTEAEIENKKKEQ